MNQIPVTPIGIATPQPPATRPGFGAGLRAFFSGIGFILGNPDVWPLAMVPIVVVVVLTGLLGWAAVALIPPQIEALLGQHGGGIMAVILKVIATALALLVALLLGLALAQPLSGPALERIVRRAEAKIGGPSWPPTGLIEDVLRSLQSVVVSFAFGLPILALLFAVDLLFPPAAFVTIPIKIVVTAILLSWDLCDYPLSIRGLPMNNRVFFMKRNLGAMFGFGLGLALIGLLPCLLLLVLPAGVAGAAQLIVKIERWEAANKEVP